MIKSEQKILIVTPLYPPDMGGPATYAHELLKTMKERGMEVDSITFTKFLRYPSGIRHVIFCIQVYKKMRDVDTVIVLDTVSVAIPTVCASLLRKRKLIIRIGGDFVWERFIERTKKKVLLSQFYISNQPLNIKEKILIGIQQMFVLARADIIVFSTAWQRELWKKPYRLSAHKTRVIENAYGEIRKNRDEQQKTGGDDVVWIGRDIILKNVDILDHAMEKIQKEFPHVSYKKYSGITHEEVMRVLKNARMLVIPSISEVSPNLALEALQSGVPVLLTKDCGLNEVLGDSVVWIDSLQEGDVHEQIKRLLNADAYTLVQAKAREFTSDRTYRQIVDEFLSL